MMQLENPVAMGAYERYAEPDRVCASCGDCLWEEDSNTPLRERFTASGRYCEGCLMDKLDAHDRRVEWMALYGGYKGFVEYLVQKQSPKDIYDELAEGVGDMLDDTLHDFIHERHLPEYRQWLMDNN